jgi:hypothetical protein
MTPSADERNAGITIDSTVAAQGAFLHPCIGLNGLSSSSKPEILNMNDTSYLARE